MGTPQEDKEGPPLLMAGEIGVAVDRVCARAKKAPGPDGIPNSMWTIIHRANPGILDAVFNIALKNRVPILYPMEGVLAGAIAETWQTSWKPNLVSATLFEQVAAEWLRKQFRGKHTLSSNQYWCRAGCSMLDVVGKLKKQVTLRK